MNLERASSQASPHLGPAQVGSLAAVLLPISAFGVALQLLIGIFSRKRTFREGQTFVSILGLVPTVPGLYLFFNPGKLAPWTKLVPFLGQTIMINGILRGDAVSALTFALSATGSLLLALLCLAGVAYLLGSESVIFGR
jgi:ABC-type Na+ efflux pump permease subunit